MTTCSAAACSAAQMATFSLLQFCLCLVAAVILFSIWLGGFGSEKQPQVRDPGIGFLSLACAAWAFNGLVVLLFQLGPFGEIYRPLISVLNSLFVIAAVAYFDVIKTGDRVIGFLSKLLRPVHKVWIAIGAGIATYIVLTRIPSLPNVFDVILSAFALICLLYALTLSFWRRGFRLLAVVAVATLLVEFLAQLPELKDVTALSNMFGTGLIQSLVDNRWPLLVVSKSMLCMLFIALAFTWMHEKVMHFVGQPEVPPPVVVQSSSIEPLRLLVHPPQIQGGKTAFEVELLGPPLNHRIPLREKTYLRIVELVLARQKPGSDGWIGYDELHPLNNPKSQAPYEETKNLMRAEYQEIRDAVAARIPLLIQADGATHKRRIWADPQHIEVVDWEKMNLFSWRNGDLWKYLVETNGKPSR